MGSVAARLLLPNRKDLFQTIVHMLLLTFMTATIIYVALPEEQESNVTAASRRQSVVNAFILSVNSNTV